MSTVSYEHQNKNNLEASPQWHTSNVVRDDSALGTVIEKISTLEVPEGEFMTGRDLRSQVEYQIRGTQPSIENPMRADMVVTDAENPSRYTYLHLLGRSVECFNIIKGESGFTVNVSQHIPFEKFQLTLPNDSQKMIALRGKVEGFDREGGGVEYQKLDPAFSEALDIFDGCRQAVKKANPVTQIRERRKKTLVASALRHTA